MGQLLLKNQSTYVPLLEKGPEEKVLLKTIVLDGDQLTEERARNIQVVFQNGDNCFDRLDGIGPTHADWHAKVNLYGVCSVNEIL